MGELAEAINPVTPTAFVAAIAARLARMSCFRACFVGYLFGSDIPMLALLKSHFSKKAPSSADSGMRISRSGNIGRAAVSRVGLVWGIEPANLPLGRLMNVRFVVNMLFN